MINLKCYYVLILIHQSKEENIMSDLKTFIKTTRDSRELKRALAVKNTLAGRSWSAVAKELEVCESFIGKWRQIYAEQGKEGLKSNYKGSKGYLNPDAKINVIKWLKKQPHWNVEHLRNYVQKQHGVLYRSRQSYYALLHEAKLSWKKTQKRNPKADPEKIKETQETLQKKINQEARHILKKETVVLFADECHLLWGDTLGYVWGPRSERIEVPIVNNRERQTS
ncbi:transposase [Beggiatoa sp. PS]|nr:transposase [Beggiatoa sp. PS]